MRQRGSGHGLKRRIERLRERARSWPALLQQVKRHALRGLRSDSRQGAQRLYQPGEMR